MEWVASLTARPLHPWTESSRQPWDRTLCGTLITHSAVTYFMAAWLLLTGSGLDDWIYWRLPLQSLVITINYNKSQSIFSRTLLPWLPRTRSILVLVLQMASDLQLDYLYIFSRRTHRKHIRCPAMNICELHRKDLFLYCCIYSALHSNGRYSIVACVFVAAGMCLPGHCLSTCHNMFWPTYYFFRRHMHLK
jgi:hypothetical protein